MNKFEKRLRKISSLPGNALVIGNGFENIDIILSIYNTVFVINDQGPPSKAKNLVYRENFDHLNQMTDISAIIFNLDQIKHLESLRDLWQRNKSRVVIEGNEPIEREFSKPLYATGWGCTSVQGFFHVWEQLK